MTILKSLKPVAAVTGHTWYSVESDYVAALASMHAALGQYTAQQAEIAKLRNKNAPKALMAPAIMIAYCMAHGLEARKPGRGRTGSAAQERMKADAIHGKMSKPRADKLFALVFSKKIRETCEKEKTAEAIVKAWAALKITSLAALKRFNGGEHRVDAKALAERHFAAVIEYTMAQRKAYADHWADLLKA